MLGLRAGQGPSLAEPEGSYRAGASVVGVPPPRVSPNSSAAPPPPLSWSSCPEGVYMLPILGESSPQPRSSSSLVQGQGGWGEGQNLHLSHTLSPAYVPTAVLASSHQPSHEPVSDGLGSELLRRGS